MNIYKTKAIDCKYIFPTPPFLEVGMLPHCPSLKSCHILMSNLNRFTCFQFRIQFFFRVYEFPGHKAIFMNSRKCSRDIPRIFPGHFQLYVIPFNMNVLLFFNKWTNTAEEQYIFIDDLNGIWVIFNLHYGAPANQQTTIFWNIQRFLFFGMNTHRFSIFFSFFLAFWSENIWILIRTWKLLLSSDFVKFEFRHVLQFWRLFLSSLRLNALKYDLLLCNSQFQFKIIHREKAWNLWANVYENSRFQISDSRFPIPERHFAYSICRIRTNRYRKIVVVKNILKRQPVLIN